MNCSFWYFFAGLNAAWAAIDFRLHSWGWFAFAVVGALLCFWLGHSDEETALRRARSDGKIDGILESATNWKRVYGRSPTRTEMQGDGPAQH